ncbi:MAG: hypothetical protein COW66_04610 [Flavobacteriaceae bacterium CG18_big_fil_WC_8_21_14_2_50_34_36]|nr:MAG: hypothetical protein COW66_04610 [Flavobacteriaceae bacterium CG18_big_fil_WC_8_21_14_2_50_34_36]PIV51485.1 MAG: hypothetical protein COS19_01045 [Flavobacteriaceae bacterium CG02_land_8_20_14_3_00_34_13]PIZ06804.1 MAG: hypothetical protein COY56_12235 [Flavobacteriaceae bacterium CG_4_10_14_0_8_um_filter_34_31]PJC07273.1 MAG: hypothetical protein CO068_06945 [Flavobacteriaceae bacterium CG_4_9_14_0_8_um_filter_34_30]
MNIIMKKVFLTSLILFSAIIAFSQPVESNETLNPRYRDIEIPKSPEVEQFGRYGLYDTNLYTGSPNVAIPIYTHKGKEMELPIVLTYDASGIKVEQTATNVGLGWNLQYGGVVTREINHLPDDLFLETGGGFGGVFYDKIYSVTSRYFINKIHDLDIRDLFGDYYDYLPPSTATIEEADILARQFWYFYKDKYKLDKIDLEPDIFKFNVNGMSDVILLDYETPEGSGYKAFAKNNPDIKISVEYQSGENTLKYLTKWIITDENGFEYYFEKQVMRHYQLEKEYKGQMGLIDRKYVEAWYLTKIISPNAFDIYTFHYSDGEYFDETHLITNRNEMAYTQHNFSGGLFEGFDTYFFLNGVVPHINSSLQFHLNEIKYNSKTIFSTITDNRQDKDYSKRYTKLNIYNTNEQITQKIDLHQSYFKKTESQNNDIYNSRLKLDGLSFYNNDPSKAKKYAFTYYSPYDIPEITSTSMDYWGYYNGKNNSSLIVDVPGGIHYGTGNRTPDFNFAIHGTLKSIFFPTGGRTTFYYEPHKLNAQIIGGIRLRKQISFTLDEDLQSSEERYYIYKDLTLMANPPVPPVNQGSLPNFNYYNSTGIDQQPLNFQKVSTVYRCVPGGTSQNFSVSMYQFSKNLAQITPNHVTYSEVSEVFFNDNKYNGHIFYKFKNENYAASGDIAKSGPYVEITPNNGKLLEKTVFGIKNNNYITLEKQENTYDVGTNLEYNHRQKGVTVFDDNELSLNVKIGLKNTGTFRKGKLLLLPCLNVVNGDGTMNWDEYNTQLGEGNFEPLTFTYPNYVIRFLPYKHLSYFSRKILEKNTSYYDNNEISKTTAYYYESPFHYKPTEIVNTISEGNELIEYTTKNYYPQDLVDNSPPEIDNSNLQYLVSQNMIGLPVKVEGYKNLDTLSTQRMFFQGGVFTSVSTAKSNLELEEKYTIHLRDYKGNPVITSVGNGLRNYYIWGYSGQLLLGQIRGLPVPQQGAPLISTIALNKINEIITESNGNNSSAVIRDKFDELRTLLPDSEITGYTHLPGIGISTVIDPKGDFISYHYDLNNRLEKTKDKNEKILTENAYHYRDLIINDDDVPESRPFAFGITAQNNFNYTYTFTAQKIYGESNNFTLNWSLLNEETTITGVNTQNQYQYIVEYECPEFSYFTSNIVVRCDITDNTTGITITQFYNKLYSCPRPFSATALVVQEVRELNPNNGQTEFLGLDFTITDFEGGTEGWVEFEWFYKLETGDYSPIPNEDMTEGGNPSTIENNFLIQGSPTMNIICNYSGTVQFKCEIRDTMSSIDPISRETNLMNISCSNNPQ